MTCQLECSLPEAGPQGVPCIILAQNEFLLFEAGSTISSGLDELL